ncbi:unnamed protein product [Symbiodinium natans]|uniref:Uncharacterized protein n=1 Tax=Symbiodinium natans TaxID=878477 RepID=A0A812RTP1_9DINO|nr:unnamed protein product [Symbiodinium natans]
MLLPAELRPQQRRFEELTIQTGGEHQVVVTIQALQLLLRTAESQHAPSLMYTCNRRCIGQASRKEQVTLLMPEESCRRYSWRGANLSALLDGDSNGANDTVEEKFRLGR